MATDWKPRVDYNDGVARSIIFPMPLETLPGLGDESVGGSRRVASGAKEGFVIAWSGLARCRLLFNEALRPDVVRWLRWAVSGQTFLFRFDQGDAATEHTVDLEEPNAGDRIVTDRHAFRPYYVAEVVLRKADGTTFDLNYFPTF